MRTVSIVGRCLRAGSSTITDCFITAFQIRCRSKQIHLLSRHRKQDVLLTVPRQQLLMFHRPCPDCCTPANGRMYETCTQNWTSSFLNAISFSLPKLLPACADWNLSLTVGQLTDVCCRPIAEAQKFPKWQQERRRCIYSFNRVSNYSCANSAGPSSK